MFRLAALGPPDRPRKRPQVRRLRRPHLRAERAHVVCSHMCALPRLMLSHVRAPQRMGCAAGAGAAERQCMCARADNLPETVRESDIEKLSFAVQLAESFYADAQVQTDRRPPSALTRLPCPLKARPARSRTWAQMQRSPQLHQPRISCVLSCKLSGNKTVFRQHPASVNSVPGSRAAVGAPWSRPTCCG